MERVASTYLALYQAWTEQVTQESPKIQRGMEDQLKVWSMRNNKTKIPLGTIGISQPELHTLPSPYIFQSLTGVGSTA